MKSWMLPMMCVAAFSLPMFSTEAQASVAEKTYDALAVSTAFDFLDDELEFDDEGNAFTSDFTGEYSEIVDFGGFSLFTLDLEHNEDSSFDINLIGVQIGPVILSQGTDSDGAQWFLFGTEQEEEPPQ